MPEIYYNNDLEKTFEYVGEYYQECDRRNQMTKAELARLVLFPGMGRYGWKNISHCGHFGVCWVYIAFLG